MKSWTAKYIKAKSPFDLDFPQEYVNGIGSGGIYSTAADLCRFLDALREGRLVDEAGLTEMNRDQQPKELVVADNTTERYGLGWDCVSMRLFEGFGKTGAVQVRLDVRFQLSFADHPGLPAERRGCPVYG